MKLGHSTPHPQYVSRSQYVHFSCEQGWEGERGRGNKGLRSLATTGWRLRQMAWSLQHSGVARLVLKSSSLTFQQILPGGWGVCHTTPRIHAAPFLPLPPPINAPTQQFQSFWPLYITFLLFFSTSSSPHTFSHINIKKVDQLDLHRADKIGSTRGADKKKRPHGRSCGGA